MSKNEMTVNIFGEDYPLAAVGDTAHVTRVAKYVDTKMKEAARAGRIQARDKVAILAALSIASELLEKSETLGFIEKDAENTVDRMLTNLDNVLQGDPAHP